MEDHLDPASTVNRNKILKHNNNKFKIKSP